MNSSGERLEQHFNKLDNGLYGPERLQKLHDERERRHEFECGLAQKLEQHFTEVENGLYDLECDCELRCLREYEFECELQSQIDMDKCVEDELEHAIDECASEQNKADDEFASRISEYENNVEAGKVIVSLKRRITDLEEEIKELERELKKHRRVESRRRRRRGS
jgi:hypothetical protein